MCILWSVMRGICARSPSGGRGVVRGESTGLEIGGGAGTVFEDGGVDVVAADGVGVAGAPVPGVFGVQEGEAEFGRQALSEIGEADELVVRGVDEPEGRSIFQSWPSAMR